MLYSGSNLQSYSKPLRTYPCYWLSSRNRPLNSNATVSLYLPHTMYVSHTCHQQTVRCQMHHVTGWWSRAAPGWEENRFYGLSRAWSHSKWVRQQPILPNKLTNNQMFGHHPDVKMDIVQSTTSCLDSLFPFVGHVKKSYDCYNIQHIYVPTHSGNCELDNFF